MTRMRMLTMKLLDAALRRKARPEPLPPIREDPLWDLVGADEGHPDDSTSVDDVLYGPKHPESA